MTRLTILFLLCVSVSATRGQSSATHALGGAEACRVVEQAAPATVRRVHVTLAPLQVKPDGGRTFAVTEKAGAVSVVPARAAAALKAILLSDSTYDAAAKLCDFTPTLRYSFEADGVTLDVDLCFGCGDMQTRFNGKFSAISPFDPAYGRLVDISKELFPDDQEIQKLDPKKFKASKPRKLPGSGFLGFVSTRTLCSWSFLPQSRLPSPHYVLWAAF